MKKSGVLKGSSNGCKVGFQTLKNRRNAEIEDLHVRLEEYSDERSELLAQITALNAENARLRLRNEAKCRYIAVTQGEIIQPGDEFFHPPSGTWKPIGDSSIGQKLSNQVLSVRRPAPVFSDYNGGPA